MSILYTSQHGWIISHLDYLYNIYKIVEDKNENKTLKFNKTFFQINSQYLRHNQVHNQKKIKDAVSSKKKKRKKLETLPEDILNQNKYVQETSQQILHDAKDSKLFTNSVVDNNEKSRLESRKFYLDSLKLDGNYNGSNSKDIAVIAKFQNEMYVFPKKSNFYCYDIKEINEKLNITNNFDLILLDPPWWNKSIRRKKIKFEESSYRMLYNEDLAQIPIRKFLNPNGIVAIWCTNSSSHIKSILEYIFPAWDVIFKAKWYWLKITQTGETICNFNETHGKQPYEQIILGTVSSNIAFEIPDKKVIISVPSAVHSHKPPLTEIFNSFLPNNSKCMEIFARYLLPEWTSWGLEVLKFQHLPLYSVIENENVYKDNNTIKVPVPSLVG